MVWVPTERLEVENEAPEPMEPSSDDDQVRLAEMVPSSTSVAVPANETELPAVNVAPSEGEVMLTVGSLLVTFSKIRTLRKRLLLPEPASKSLTSTRKNELPVKYWPTGIW